MEVFLPPPPLGAFVLTGSQPRLHFRTLSGASEEQRLNSEQGLIQGVQQQWQKPHGLSSDPSLFSNKYTFFCQKHSLYLAASSLSFGSQALLVASLILST